MEDSPDDVILTQRTLRKSGLGALVHVCHDGEQALQYLTELTAELIPHLVLLDWKLPRLTGNDVLAWMRKRTPTQAIPVVVLSSSRMQEDIDQAMASGADYYLEKPLERAAFVGIAQALKLHFAGVAAP